MIAKDAEHGEAAAFSNRGATIRLFGVILVILGTLDMMLSWRGSFAVEPFHAGIFVTGVVLCLIGAIRRRGRSGQDES
ncbi:MAG: hypothetical protein QF521_17870 [Alphaproteobacteria bacterium]|jgi:hypothetical protein|nr:hypothetical protein [Alphaproteobacteria bacterium]